MYKNKFSLSHRLAIYPFNIADSIKLVSFRYHFDKVPASADTLVMDSLLEIRALSRADIHALTDLLFNNFYIKRGNIGSISRCFQPRNAILFFDNQKRIKEYILVCFRCSRYETSSEKVWTGDDCTENTSKLAAYFKAKGITYGTDKRRDDYPRETDHEETIIPPPDSPAKLHVKNPQAC